MVISRKNSKHQLLAIFLALKALYKNSSHVHINFQCDNTSAIAYINDMGGMSSISMDNLAKTIWLWCIDREIHISATYVASIDNSADYFSRNFWDSIEWMLNKNGKLSQNTPVLPQDVTIHKIS